MSFQKLSKEERAEWRNLPATKSAIEFLRLRAKQHAERALLELRNGDKDNAAVHAGGEEACRIVADILEND